MSRARRPPDRPRCACFDGRVCERSEAMDRIGLDERVRPLEEALEQWFFFATGKQTYVSVKGATTRPDQRASPWQAHRLGDRGVD